MVNYLALKIIETNNITRSIRIKVIRRTHNLLCAILFFYIDVYYI